MKNKAWFFITFWHVLIIPFAMYFLAPTLDAISAYFDLQNTLIGFYYALSTVLLVVWVFEIGCIYKTFKKAFPSLFYAHGGYVGKGSLDFKKA